ncbi:glycosyltransferase [Candidatus Saganbacteria bacterium]|nr:glycosyltransferase [Candidatus Saganbacteria bacterium]
MFFSVIIPLYNGEKHIEKTLDCVKGQTYQDYEIIICDDGSMDHSGEIVKSYMEDHLQLEIKYIRQENKGLGGARNSAIRMAKGDVLALIDQDDIWYSDKLYEVNKIFNDNPSIDYVGHNEAIKKNDMVVGISSYGPIGRDFFRQLLFDRNCLSTSASCFKKDVIKRIGYFTEDREREHFVEDYDLWLRMAASGCNFYMIEKILGEYVLHNDNCSTNSPNVMSDHEANVLQKHWYNYENKRSFDNFRYRLRMAKLYMAAAINCRICNKWDLVFHYGNKALLANPLIVFVLLKLIPKSLSRLFFPVKLL